MSKLTKLFKHPTLFFSDMQKKKQGTQKPAATTTTAPEALAPAPKAAPPKPAAPTKPPIVQRPQSFYLEKILDLKQSMAVNRLKYKDYSLWPALRSELMIQCDIAWKKNIQNKIAFNPFQSQLCRSANISFERGSDLASNFDYFRCVDDLASDNIDFLFFSNLNSTDQVEIGGKIYNRLVDPLYEAAKKIGSAHKVELIKAASPAVDKIKKYHNTPICIIPPCIYQYGYSDAINLPKKFLPILQQKIPFIEFSEERLNAFFDWHLHMLDFYRRLLARLNPKVVFFHPYYYYTPLIAAARERGIKTVDIQHGVMVGYNEVFYDNWQETPQLGYQALPDYFLVWSELEHQHLEQVFSHVAGEFSHRAIVSGYPWLDYEVKADIKIASHVKKINKFIQLGKKSVLVTLQRDSLIPKNVEAIIASSGDDVRWLIRRHPKGAAFMSSVKKLKNVLFGDAVDRVELRDLFKLVDYNFTDGSSTVLEADYFGVYSFVYGEEGVMNYKELITSGRVGLIPDAMNKYEELHLGAENRQVKIGYFQNVDISALLEKILRQD